MKSKEELKKLFENGDRPTQKEFWEWQDSYWHKEEKLPTENEGNYRIKGSVANLDALNALTDMSQGDVYNLLNTGDNYVYVLDLNNTGEAGWDQLSGIVDLSSINLQTVLENGYQAIGVNGNSTYDIYSADEFQNSYISFSQVSNDYEYYSYFGQSVSNVTIPMNELASIDMLVKNKDKEFSVQLRKNALAYLSDYSADFIDRSLVDKAYVDSKVSLQGVLNNGSYAIDEATQSVINIDLSNGGFQTYLQDSNQSILASISSNLMMTSIVHRDGLGESFINVVTGSEGMLFSNTSPISNLTAQVALIGNQGLVYAEDYSSRFTNKSLVDKAYVDASFTRTKDIEITDSTKGIILTSPIGNRFRVTVADDGTLTTTAFD